MNIIKKLFGKRETSLVKGVRYVFDNGRVFFDSKSAAVYQLQTGYNYKMLRKLA